MLPAQHRMRRPGDFAQAIRGPVRAARPPLVVHLRKEEGDTVAGFVVGKGVGNAPRRNRVKRRLRALVAGSLPTLPDGLRLVVRALPGAAEASWEQLACRYEAALSEAMRKLVPPVPAVEVRDA